MYIRKSFVLLLMAFLLPVSAMDIAKHSYVQAKADLKKLVLSDCKSKRERLLVLDLGDAIENMIKSSNQVGKKLVAKDFIFDDGEHVLTLFAKHCCDKKCCVSRLTSILSMIQPRCWQELLPMRNVAGETFFEIAFQRKLSEFLYCMITEKYITQLMNSDMHKLFVKHIDLIIHCLSSRGGKDAYLSNDDIGVLYDFIIKNKLVVNEMIAQKLSEKLEYLAKEAEKKLAAVGKKLKKANKRRKKSASLTKKGVGLLQKVTPEKIKNKKIKYKGLVLTAGQALEMAQAVVEVKEAFEGLKKIREGKDQESIKINLEAEKKYLEERVTLCRELIKKLSELKIFVKPSLLGFVCTLFIIV